ncbi:hypothetical protein EYZ11_002939 [Aspergillus tanneri]|uniref:Type I Polyketide synthases (Type I PKS) n=1 Tax=Aspergillus tanneri TaxID=1220188 RepID=A0A4V3UQ45_9EURO|nr:hypothetical protein EYZ11_002939 [Aspergillus tanneri]
MHIYLIGDQTASIFEEFQNLLHDREDAFSQSFLNQVYFLLRAEVAKVRGIHSDSLPRFSSLADLLLIRRDGKLHASLDQALACAFQIATFMSRCGKSGGLYPQPGDSYVVGLCTGTLSAAAICASRTLTELIPAGLKAVTVAFKTGLLAQKMAQVVEKPSKLGRDNSWSAVFCGIGHASADESIRIFSDEHALPPLSMPFVSAVAENNVTVTAPPSVMVSLKNSASFSQYRNITLPLQVPYHSRHLFTESDILSILDSTNIDDCYNRQPFLPLVSGYTGKTVWAGTFRSLLEASLQDILLNPIRWDLVAPRVAKMALSVSESFPAVHPIATGLGRSLTKAMEFEAGPSFSRTQEPRSKPESPSAGIKSRVSSGTAGSKIAIVGMSGRFPGGGDSNELFWQLLRDGVDTHKVVPARSWNVETHTDPTMKRKNTAATPYGCWLDHPELFDNRFFYISPREAPQVDPAQRLALMTAYEAIEQAGIVPDGSPSTQKDRVGIFYGCTSQDWMETNSPQNIDTFYIPGGNRAFIPGRINYFFKFSGPSLSIDTACSSSLAAINVACLSLWNGDTDCAIAGGTNVLTNPDPTAGLDRGHFLSRTGNCKTFDDGADGYCRGEGAATVILKRLEDALAENDPIQGVICGAFTNHSAEAESITRPHVGAQRAIFRKVMDQAGVDPQDVSYVEMHGTGTQAGDAAEMSSVLHVFAPEGAKPRKDDHKLYLGSAKANIGHGEAVSGVSSLVKVLMMLKKNEIPPHIGIKTKINHRFPADLTERGVHIAREPTAWNWTKGQRKAFINNFSAAGGNTAILIEEAPPVRTLEGRDPRSTHVVAVSAQTAPSLKANMEALKAHISTLPNTENVLAQLSYTTTARRMHHMYRHIVYGSTLSDIKAQLQSAIDADAGSKRVVATPSVVFAFTGQGSQYPGMARQLMNDVDSFRMDIAKYEQVAIAQGFSPFKHILTASDGESTDYPPTAVQLAIVALEMALFNLWRSWGVSPTAVVGHSLGEYAALNAAGVLSDSDTIYLVGTRAQLLERHCSQGTHSMLAVKAAAESVAPHLTGSAVEVACINGPQDVVLSGRADIVNKFQKRLAELGFKSTLLKVPFAFHSSQVDPLLADFEASYAGVRFSDATVPVLRPLTADVTTEGKAFSGDYLARHCRQKVDMLGAVRTAEQQKVVAASSVLIELGPQPVVSGMFKSTVPSVTALPTLKRGGDTWSLIPPAMAALYNNGVAGLKFAEYHRPFPASHRVLELNSYSWSLQPFWMQYEHDWSLKKGDPPTAASAVPLPQSKPFQQLEQQPEPPKPKAMTLKTTTVHKVVEEKLDGSGGSLITESDIASEELSGFVKGHVVNGVPLCTPSVYCDIALTIGKYLRDKYRNEWASSLVEVSDMVVERALVAQTQGPQYLRAVARIDWSTKSITTGFHSADAAGNLLAKHAACVIRYSKPEVSKDLATEAKASRERIDRLYDGLAKRTTYRFSKNMAYRAVSALATFDPDHQAVTEVVLDSDNRESSSTVNLSLIKKGGDFHTHPAFIDNISQGGGFVMNCNDDADLTKHIYVNHGWRSYLELEPLDPSKTYMTHVQMKEGEGGMWEGNVLVFNGDKLAARFGRVLESGSKAPSKQATKSQPQPKPQPSQTAAIPKPGPPTSAPVPAAESPLLSVRKADKVAKPSSGRIEKVIAILSEESGVPSNELTDETNFADIGIDSLLITIVSGRLMEELDIDIDSREFLDELLTVKDLKRRLSEGEPEDEASEIEAASAPPIEVNYVAQEARPEPVVPQPALRTTQAPQVDFEPMLKIISEESGVPLEELTDDVNFADAGIDSLLCVLITGRWQEELSLEVDSTTVFSEMETIRGLKNYLASILGVPEVPVEPQISALGHTDSGSATSLVPDDTGESSTDEDRSWKGLTPATTHSGHSTPPPSTAAAEKLRIVEESRPPRRAIPDEQVPKASSLLLQGRPRTGVKNLFLFPDGSGSASSYSRMGKLQANVAVIGLNCPYVRNPEAMTCTLDQMIRRYLDEIRRRQPIGPYSLGGWSAGGILAYRAAQELIREGETVDDLVLLDSPEPIGLNKLPQRFIDHLESCGLWTDGSAGNKENTQLSARVAAHFDAIMDLLCDYYADPLPEGYTPKVSILWATECLLDGVRFPKLPAGDDDVEDMKFLTEPRSDFSAGRWANFFPGEEIFIERAAGLDHFGMMRSSDEAVARFLERAFA